MEPSPLRAPDDLPRAIRERVLARMLLAMRDGWAPLPIDDAWARLDAMAARFNEGLEQFTDPSARGFYAALNDDPDLAEAFELLAEDVVAPAEAVPASLAARLAAIPRDEGVRARPPRDLSFLRAYAQEVGVRIAELRDKLANWQPGMSLPSSAHAFRRDAGDESPTTGVGPLTASVEDEERDLILTLVAVPAPTGTWRLTVQVEPMKDPPGSPSPTWAVAARLADRELAVEPEGPEIWHIRDPLTAAELAEVTVSADRAAGNPR